MSTTVNEPSPFSAQATHARNRVGYRRGGVESIEADWFFTLPQDPVGRNYDWSPADLARNYGIRQSAHHFWFAQRWRATCKSRLAFAMANSNSAAAG